MKEKRRGKIIDERDKDEKEETRKKMKKKREDQREMNRDRDERKDDFFFEMFQDPQTRQMN